MCQLPWDLIDHTPISPCETEIISVMGSWSLVGRPPCFSRAHCRESSPALICDGPHASDLSRTHLLHELEHSWCGDGGWRLLNDLLVPPLDGTVTPKQRHGVPVLISEDLDLQVAGMLGQLHEKDRGAWDLTLNLGGRRLQALHYHCSRSDMVKIDAEKTEISLQSHLLKMMCH